MAPSRRATAAGQPVALAYASLQVRVVAFILDIMVLLSFGMLFGAGVGAYLVVDNRLNDGSLSDRAPYVFVAVLLAYFLVFLPLYHVLLWRWWGQTLGKMAVRIKVTSRAGGPVSLERSALRLIGYAASIAPLFLGIVIALFDRERRTLHDRLADTVVVELP
jgi:uncharacterized RDD family membrane protein YckC